MQGARKNIISLVSFILTGLFIIQVITIAAFMHSHRLADGRIISHAHPYHKSTGDSPEKTHNHSKSEYQLIETTGKLFPFFLIAAFLSVLVQTAILPCYALSAEKSPELNICNGRSPPCCA